MEQEIKLHYINPALNIGMANIRQVYLLSPVVTTLQPEVFRGRLVYRARGSAKRISYAVLKKGLLKKTFTIKQEVPHWLL